MIRLLLTLLALAFALPVAVPAHAAKTLIVNANGYTLDSNGSLKRFQMLLVGDNGQVLATLPRGATEPKLAAGDYKLDARGKTLIPGLIDAHGHIMDLGIGLRQLDLAPATSLADAQLAAGPWLEPCQLGPEHLSQSRRSRCGRTDPPGLA